MYVTEIRESKNYSGQQLDKKYKTKYINIDLFLFNWQY